MQRAQEDVDARRHLYEQMAGDRRDEHASTSRRPTR